MDPDRSGRLWRLAPALVGIVAVGLMATSATVATGSTNPAVWTQRAASTIKSVGHLPQSKAGPVASPKPKPTQGDSDASGQRSPDGPPANSANGERHPSPADRPERSPHRTEGHHTGFSDDRSGGNDVNLLDAHLGFDHQWRTGDFRLWRA
jgi:hypothetical protein